MLSNELARLAGVTVRALRHYHRIGVLVEPERRSNGYREYDVHDLIRVLRIKRLAALGIPLDRMPALLDDDANEAGELLDELDAELTAQIDRLIGQRAIIAHLRTSGAAPDLPPELAPFLAAFAAGQSRERATYDRDQSVLLAHFAGVDGLAQIARLYERLSDSAIAPAVKDIDEKFGPLGPDSTDREVNELTELFAAVLTPIVADRVGAEPTVDLAAVADIFAQHSADLLNEQQQRLLEHLERRLGGDA